LEKMLDTRLRTVLGLRNRALGDLAVAVPGGDEVEHLALPCGQIGEQVLVEG
jgi:hypothetical protein